MAYINKNIGFGHGRITTTSRRVENAFGYFEEGTKVEIVGISEKGYDLQDEYGNRIIGTGFDSVVSEFDNAQASKEEEKYVWVVMAHTLSDSKITHIVQIYSSEDKAVELVKEINNTRFASKMNPMFVKWKVK